MDIYFAGPLFTSAEIAFNSEVVGYLRSKGHRVFLPQESEANVRAAERADENSAHDIFQSDADAVEACEVIVANLDGPDPDSGTSWELGYAYGLGKHIICYRTDFRVHEGFDPINLMLTESADAVLMLPNTGPLDVALTLHDAIKDLVDDDTSDT